MAKAKSSSSAKKSKKATEKPKEPEKPKDPAEPDTPEETPDSKEAITAATATKEGKAGLPEKPNCLFSNCPGKLSFIVGRKWCCNVCMRAYYAKENGSEVEPVF